MSVVYLNGQYLDRRDAMVSVEDRGFLLADGVYEVVRCYRGKPFALDRHHDRLQRSLAAIRLDTDTAFFPEVSRQLLERNGLDDAKLYWQITRGPAPRNHVFPDHTQPTVLAMADPAATLEPADELPTITAALVEDRRWLDCGIKSLMLLANVLARQQARDAGADEAIFHRGPVVTEGAATSALAVIDGELRTHPADGSILAGVTRAVVLELARQLDIPVREDAPTLDELPRADELILTGTTTHVTAVTRLDGRPLTAGPVAEKLHRAFIEHVLKEIERP